MYLKIKILTFSLAHYIVLYKRNSNYETNPLIIYYLVMFGKVEWEKEWNS